MGKSSNWSKLTVPLLRRLELGQAAEMLDVRRRVACLPLTLYKKTYLNIHSHTPITLHTLPHSNYSALDTLPHTPTLHTLPHFKHFHITLDKLPRLPHTLPHFIHITYLRSHIRYTPTLHTLPHHIYSHTSYIIPHRHSKICVLILTIFCKILTGSSSILFWSRMYCKTEFCRRNWWRLSLALVLSSLSGLEFWPSEGDSTSLSVTTGSASNSSP